MSALRAGIPATTFQEFVAYAKANPGKLRYGTSGVGSPTHLSFQYLADVLGIQMTHVPYRGNMQAVQALLQGEIDMTVVNAVGFEKQIQSGEIRVLAQTSRKKAAGLPTCLAWLILYPALKRRSGWAVRARGHAAPDRQPT